MRGGAPAGLLAGLAAGLLGVDGKSLGQQRGLQQQVAMALMGGAVDDGTQVDERGVHDQSAFQKSANTYTDRKYPTRIPMILQFSFFLCFINFQYFFVNLFSFFLKKSLFNDLKK